MQTTYNNTNTQKTYSKYHAPAHVEKIRWRAAVQFDDVHGAHGQTCPIHKAADVSIKGDVTEAEFLGMQLSQRWRF